VNRLLLTAAAAVLVASPALAQFTVGFSIGCHPGVAVPYAPYSPYAPYTPYIPYAAPVVPVAPVAPYAPYAVGPGPMVPSPINPSATGMQPGTGGPPGTGAMPPGPGSCDLISAIKDLTREVREFKEAYKQVNKDKLQKVSLDPSPEGNTVDDRLARLKAAQAGSTAGAEPRGAVDRQLAVLKQAQAGSRPAMAVATR